MVNKNNPSLRGARVAQKQYWRLRCDAFDSGVTMTDKYLKNSFFVAGLMLYWGEGSKKSHTSLANSDARLISLFIKWLDQFFKIGTHQIMIQLHVHQGQNINQLKKYWSKITSIPLINFQKTFIKPTINYKHNYKKLYFGTIRLRVKKQGSTYLLFTILGALAKYIKLMNVSKIKYEDWMDKPRYA